MGEAAGSVQEAAGGRQPLLVLQTSHVTGDVGQRVAATHFLAADPTAEEIDDNYHRFPDRLDDGVADGVGEEVHLAVDDDAVRPGGEGGDGLEGRVQGRSHLRIHRVLNAAGKSLEKKSFIIILG